MCQVWSRNRQNFAGNSCLKIRYCTYAYTSSQYTNYLVQPLLLAYYLTIESAALAAPLVDVLGFGDQRHEPLKLNTEALSADAPNVDMDA